ncbi:MAG: hydroxymethylbilane synthase [Pirellulaceae bacterium]|nr:hydroxymethylbilane synthase [Pirellulaceae bacterium]
MIKLGSRSSKLARWQAEHVQTELSKKNIEVEIVFMTTEGDQSVASLKEFGGVGAFTKGIQQSILNGEIDFAVHSLKDLPTDPVEGLVLASVPLREDPADVLICNGFSCTSDLPAGARIGTGSLRRQAQLLYHRPDLKVMDIRGNVDTRLKKLDAGEFDALVLAKAGLTRLKLVDRITEEFGLEWMLPAIGQGALGLESRVDDQPTRMVLDQICDHQSLLEVTAERALLRHLRAGCLAPVGAHGRAQSDGELSLDAVVLSQDGSQRVEIQGQQRMGTDSLQTAKEMGRRLGQQLIDKGADVLLRR